MFCMPDEYMVKQITEVLTPKQLCSLFETASLWQSLVNVSLLLQNYWFFPHSEYSALIIALELENIVRHGGSVLCDDLKQFRVDRLILLSQFFNEKMPLVPATIANQVPLYERMFQDFVPRGYEESNDEDYLHNLTAIVYSTKELLYDYDFTIHEHSIRFPQTSKHIFFSPYDGFGNFELNNCCELPINSVDDSQLNLIRELQERKDYLKSSSSVKSLNYTRKRHHSSVIL